MENAKRTNLEIIQKISKVLEIISRVVMALCVVGIICTIIGAVSLSTISLLGGETPDRIEEASGRRMSMIIGSCLVGVVMCVSEFLVAKFSRDYFRMELQAGTPFTEEGAKSFRALGITNIVVPLVAFIICTVIEVITGCESFDIEIGMSAGIVMVLLSYVFGYGAELEQKKTSEIEARN